MFYIDSVMFIKDHTLLPDKKRIVEEASENVTLAYSLGNELLCIFEQAHK